MICVLYFRTNRKCSKIVGNLHDRMSPTILSHEFILFLHYIYICCVDRSDFELLNKYVISENTSLITAALFKQLANISIFMHLVTVIYQEK